MRAEFPVVEIFGPTIQGEGPLIGSPCYFIRFGGCDYRCSWCDSMHAVDPGEVRKAPLLDPYEILERLENLPGSADWVILSGGNPALHDLGLLCSLLRERSFKVQVETQGSIWAPWLLETDLVVVSPKPPSSGMSPRLERLSSFFRNLPTVDTRLALKFVVFGPQDLEFARDILHEFDYLDSSGPDEHRREVLPVFFSAGTDVDSFSVQGVLERTRWLAETVSHDHELYIGRVLPQLHALLWGQEKGR